MLLQSARAFAARVTPLTRATANSNPKAQPFVWQMMSRRRSQAELAATVQYLYRRRPCAQQSAHAPAFSISKSNKKKKKYTSPFLENDNSHTSQCWHAAVVQTLLQHGADVAATDNVGAAGVPRACRWRFYITHMARQCACIGVEVA